LIRILNPDPGGDLNPDESGFETLFSEALCVISLENFGFLNFIRNQNQLSITEIAYEKKFYSPPAQ
jgi:hypothetical protein